MNYVYLGKETVENLSDVHALFARAFSFPAYYGNNFDALYDCLSSLSEPSLVLICDADVLRTRLGARYDTLRTLLDDALENPNLRIRELESAVLL